MEWGDKIEWLQDLEEEDGKTPSALLRQPDLSPDEEEILAAFFSLSRDRALGLALGQIPWSSIDRYAVRYGIAGDAFERLCFLLKKMDSAYLKFAAEKSRTQSQGR